MIRPGKRLDERLPADCEQIPVALTDVDKLTGIVADSSAVIYCAGSVRGRTPADFAEANIAGVKAMLNALGGVDDAPPLLLLSSLAASRPQVSNYSDSKYQGEQLLKESSMFPWTILRPPAIYGPGDKEMLPLLKMARRGLLLHAGSRQQRLSLLHVDDLAQAVEAWLLQWQQCLHETYSIDDGRPGGYAWDDIGAAVSKGRYNLLKIPNFILANTARLNLLFARYLGYSPMLTPGKVQELIQPDWLSADNQRFNAATGWNPALDLKTGAWQLFEQVHQNLHE
jgi:nucleoside-diphosphate-sugar epimerase